jgi:5-methylcytosine-specific restriction enzyme A
MIPESITRENILKALDAIDKAGVPKSREATKYGLNHNNKLYPPKYVISIANRFAHGIELDPELFSGGDETNGYLEQLGFQIALLDEQDSRFPFTSYSWKILSNTLFIKEMDKSSFIHFGTVIPKEIRKYFDADTLEQGQIKHITLTHQAIQYQARIELDSYDSPRARLFWKSDFAKLIEKQLPGWREVFETGDKVDTERPNMRLSSAGQEPDIYSVEFIDPNRLIEDIKNEIYEEQQSNLEGGVKHYFGKRYERNPDNRRMAIEIHGMTCLICGFDFEKFYGEHGRGFIEIHHNKPLSSLDEKELINPTTDLSPVCSNCHRMIHRKREQVLSVNEMKSIINN